MPKVEMNVDQILTSVVAVAIEPGDKLLVMGNMLVGIIERREDAPAPEPDSLIRTETKKAAAMAANIHPSPKARAPRPDGRPFGSGRHAYTDVLQLSDTKAVLDLIVTHGPMTANQIGTTLKKRGSGVILKRLQQTHSIARVDTGDNRYPAYKAVLNGGAD